LGHEPSSEPTTRERTMWGRLMLPRQGIRPLPVNDISSLRGEVPGIGPLPSDARESSRPFDIS